MHRQRTYMRAALLVAVGLVVGATYSDIVSSVAYAMERGKAAAAGERITTRADLTTAFQDIAEAVKPSVVNISSVRRIEVSQRDRMDIPFFSSPFREFFGEEFQRRLLPQPRQRDFAQQGLGTGVIISENGYIVTNNHVVEDADEVTVRLSDDRTFTADVVGTDPKTDLAVIKIDAGNLYAATLGDSDDLRVGQWVAAVGNPFGLTHTLTSGIVSAIGRSNMGIVDYEDFIQTDAAINPGNSGGPLVNLRGEVVGINTAIFTKYGGYMGIGFSIPINMVKSVTDALIEEGRVVRGFLGVLIQDLDEGLAETFGYEDTRGALIADVTPGGPADEAGLRQGDIVITYDGKAVEDTTQLKSMVAETKPQERVALEVFRDGERKTIYVEIGELESQGPTLAKAEPVEDKLGLQVRSLTPEIAGRLGLDRQEGVIVTAVKPFSPAARAGLQPRDVILDVQGKRVDSVQEFRSRVAAGDVERGVRLRVQRGELQRFALLRTKP